MALRVYTARLSSADDDALDISRSGNTARAERGGHRGIANAFVPSRAIVLARLHLVQGDLNAETDLSWLAYAKAYLGELRRSYAATENQHAWETLLSWHRVVLLGDSPDPARCETRVLACDVLAKLGAKYMGEIA